MNLTDCIITPLYASRKDMFVDTYCGGTHAHKKLVKHLRLKLTGSIFVSWWLCLYQGQFSSEGEPQAGTNYTET
jgi:hypothetical protein